MENWNQVAKYEQISANSYGTAIEKMEAYTSGVEAAQKRLTASMEKLALWFNNFGVLEGLYNTAATLVDNMAIFSAALLASAIAISSFAWSMIKMISGKPRISLIPPRVLLNFESCLFN